MKTFKWTVPEFPDRTIPGLGYLLGGILTLCLAGSLISSGISLKGIRSYFWKSATGVVLSSDLKQRTNERSISGFGTVTYRISDGDTIEATDSVFRKWEWKTAGKYEKWAAQYAVGSEVNVYYSRSGETSLGHWPASSLWGIMPAWVLIMGLICLFRGLREIKESHRDSKGPNECHS